MKSIRPSCSIFMALSVTVLIQFTSTISLASASAFDAHDKANLSIYTRQGYYINTDLRSQIPITTVSNFISHEASPTCANLLKANAPYLSKIGILPYKKMKPTDSKLFHLIQDALVTRGQATPRLVYRGAHSCDFLMQANGQPVKWFLEKAFMSTSASEEVAQRFTVSMNMMEEEGEKSPTGCLMKIQAVSGVPIAEATGNYNGEEEILFPARALFEVTDFKMNGEQRVFTLKEVPRNTEEYSKMSATILQEKTQVVLSELYSELAVPNAKAGASQQFNLDAEIACRDAYMFFTNSPEIRKSISAKKPAYDLSNKKLNSDDYLVEE